MNKIFSWTNNPTYSNKWDRIALTKAGALIAAWVSVDGEGVYTASIVDNASNEPDVIKGEFKTLDEAKQFADRELRKQGYSS